MKEHCLIALWLCRCVEACLMLGVWSHKWGSVGVLEGVEISLASVETSPEEIRLHPNQDFEFPINNGCFRHLFRTFNF